MYKSYSARPSGGKSSFGGRKPSRFNNSRGGGGNRSGGGNRGKRFGQNIDPKRFIKAAKNVETVEYVPENRFSDFKLNDLIQRNLAKKGFEAPTQIQDKAIPVATEGKDVIGIANTGTGKTAAFMLPILTRLMADRNQKALIVAPTRELALQIVQESRAFTAGSKVFDVLLIGGVNIGPQFRDLKRHPQIIVGTPGRIKDHIERGSLDLSSVSTIVLDEVDRMLDMGFINDIRSILAELPSEKQSFFFSATMSPTIENLIKTFTHSPVSIMARTAETSDNVDQSVVKYNATTDKIEKLHDLLNEAHVEKTLIFCETKRSTESLARELESRGFTSDAMHGNKSQSQRQRALKKFSGGHVDILVATDVAARGIDVKNITHVINYDVPQTYDDYTHRIGRTGRGGKTGFAVTFIR